VEKITVCNAAVGPALKRLADNLEYHGLPALLEGDRMEPEEGI